MEILDSKLRHEKKTPQNWKERNIIVIWDNMIVCVKNPEEFKSHKNKYAYSVWSLPRRTVYKNQFYFYILRTNNLKWNKNAS